MKHRARFTPMILAAALVVAGCNKDESSPTVSNDRSMLVGAWRSKIAFRSGPLSGMTDLEFLYSYNAGGTMTESSNYDEAANSSPPAYGIWKEIDPKTFQTKYMFYTTKEPGTGVPPGNKDWWPAGHGILTETITLSANGQTYTSTIKLDTYDTAGVLISAASGEGTGAGTRIAF